MSSLKRLFLDSNVFIIGDADQTSSESLILEALGYRNQTPILEVEIILSIADFECLTTTDFINKYLKFTLI